MFWMVLAILGVPTSSAPSPRQTTVAAPEQAGPGMRVKCRNRTETGSLAKRTRICRTVADWRKVDEEQHSGAERAVDQGRVSCGSCLRGG